MQTDDGNRTKQNFKSTKYEIFKNSCKKKILGKCNKKKSGYAEVVNEIYDIFGWEKIFKIRMLFLSC